jgi:lipoate-protein ligase A
MSVRWRLIVQGASPAYDNMAIDEAILRHVAGWETERRSPPTLRFYTWDPSAVSIGYFQGIEQEVDLATCKAEGVEVIRRLTGGGAVFHDRDGEITYSLAISNDYPGVPSKVLDSYGILCEGLVLGFKSLGLSAEFKPINDILVDGKKISGNAQTRRFGGILQHGTLLRDVNPELMFSLLKVPNEKIRDKLIENVESRVTSISQEFESITDDEVIEAMIHGFENALDIELVPGTLSRRERELAERIKAERYETDEWNFKR